MRAANLMRGYGKILHARTSSACSTWTRCRKGLGKGQAVMMACTPAKLAWKSDRGTQQCRPLQHKVPGRTESIEAPVPISEITGSSRCAQMRRPDTAPNGGQVTELVIVSLVLSLYQNCHMFCHHASGFHALQGWLNSDAHGKQNSVDLLFSHL